MSRLKVEHMARSHKNVNVEFILCKLGLETSIHIGDSYPLNLLCEPSDFGGYEFLHAQIPNGARTKP